MRLSQECSGIRTMIAGAVERFGAWCSRITHDRAVRRIDDRKSASRIVERGEWIVSAGVEDDDPHPARDRFQRRHHVDQPDRTVDQIKLGGNPCINRNEIIFARELHAVAGIINHCHRVRPAAGNLGGEVLHDLDHLIVTEIGGRNDFKARGIEQLRDGLGVVGGIWQLGHVLIVRIADHQRDALFRAAQAHGIADVGRPLHRFGISPCRPDGQQAGEKKSAQ